MVKNKSFINLTNYPHLKGFAEVFILIKVLFHSLNSILIEGIPMRLRLRQSEGTSLEALVLFWRDACEWALIWSALLRRSYMRL